MIENMTNVNLDSTVDDNSNNKFVGMIVIKIRFVVN